MSTNKTTPSRDDLVYKNSNFLLGAGVSQTSHNLPTCVLDIKHGNSRDGFTFVVCTRSVHSSRKPDVAAVELDLLDAEYRNWLLAKFKLHLRGLSSVDKLRPWVHERLTLLKEYCAAADVNYDTLYVRSALPPAVVSSTLTRRVLVSNTDTTVAYGRLPSTDTESEGDKKRSRSVEEFQIAQPSRVVLSKAAKRRILHMRFKALASKYSAQPNVNREALLRELEALRPHVHDM